MIAYYATLVVESEDGPDLERIVTNLKALVTEREPGVLLYQLCRSRHTAGVYHMMELYADEAAREKHENTDWYREAAPRFTALLREDMTIETYDAL